MTFIGAKPIELLNSRALQQHLFSLLQNCKTNKELIQIHTQIITNGFTQKNYILAKLLSFCIASSELLSHAHQAFQQIETPSTSVWNQIIRGYSRSETPKKSIQLFNEMERTEVKPDEFTYSFLLTACTRPYLLREGEQLHGRLLSNGLYSNSVLQTNLVNMYAMAEGVNGFTKARQVFDEMYQRSMVTWNLMLSVCLKLGKEDEARKIFDEMPGRNVVSWTTMISGYARNGRCKQALTLFNEMRKARVELDQAALVSALSACAEIGDLKSGRWIHSFIDEVSTDPHRSVSVSLYNALIHMYASCGEIQEAYKVFEKMPKRSVVSWTTLIMGFAKQGCGEEAIGVFDWMLSLGVRPDDVTFLGVLCACSHTGMVEEGRHYFDYMINSCGIEPRIEHYGCMVDLLSRAGLLDEALKLIETIPMKPNDVLWGALLGGCRTYKNIELGNYVGEQMAEELEPDRAAGYLVLLSDVYAAAKRWDNVASVRRKMVEMGVKKPAGRSSIQVNGVIHDFVAGDWTHKHASAIYDMVSKILELAKLENHMLDQGGGCLGIEIFGDVSN